MEEPFYLVDDVIHSRQMADRAYGQFVENWLPKLPSSCEFHHVGATSIPGCATKGDLDICIQVSDQEFQDAKAVLASAFPLNDGSVSTDFFCAFSDEENAPPLGIQLVEKGSELDIFILFRTYLLENPQEIEMYNQLKEKFHGKEMTAYRQAKSEFIEACLFRAIQNTRM